MRSDLEKLFLEMNKLFNIDFRGIIDEQSIEKYIKCEGLTIHRATSLSAINGDRKLSPLAIGVATGFLGMSIGVILKKRYHDNKKIKEISDLNDEIGSMIQEKDDNLENRKKLFLERPVYFEEAKSTGFFLFFGLFRFQI
jgi:hypothetical protein